MVNGIIADEGYGALFIYVHGYPEKLKSHSVAQIADELRKVISPAWTIRLTNESIQIESKADVWLLGISLPGRDSNESDEHYAKQNGYKTKYQITLNFVPRLTEAQLEEIRQVRRPWERAFEKGDSDKAKASELANTLGKHPLPTFYTDDLTIFMESPFGAEGVYPPEADARVVRVITLLEKMFKCYPVTRWTAEWEQTPRWKIQS